MVQPRCPHCKTGRLYVDEYRDRCCVNCGWVAAPAKPLPLVRETESVKTPRLQGGGRR